jgi:hypothetical protein
MFIFYFLCEAWNAVPRALAVEAQEAFLHHIVGVAAIAQQGPGHAEGEAHVAFNEELEGRFLFA